MCCEPVLSAVCCLLSAVCCLLSAASRLPTTPDTAQQQPGDQFCISEKIGAQSPYPKPPAVPSSRAVACISAEGLRGPGPVISTPEPAFLEAASSATPCRDAVQSSSQRLSSAVLMSSSYLANGQCFLLCGCPQRLSPMCLFSPTLPRFVLLELNSLFAGA